MDISQSMIRYYNQKAILIKEIVMNSWIEDAKQLKAISPNGQFFVFGDSDYHLSFQIFELTIDGFELV